MNEYASATNQLLAMVELHAHTIWWQRTEDAKNKRNVPAFILDQLVGGGSKTQGESLEIDEYMEILAKPRKEVQHG